MFAVLQSKIALPQVIIILVPSFVLSMIDLRFIGFVRLQGIALPGAFLSCFGKKGSKEADRGKALHKIFRYVPVFQSEPPDFIATGPPPGAARQFPAQSSFS